MNSENNSKTQAVAQKVKETDEKAHQQLQKIQKSKIGELLPTEYKEISTKKVALIAIVLNGIMFLYTYILFIALYPIKDEQAFIRSFWGMSLGALYILNVVHDIFIYYFDKSTMLLSFLGLRTVSLIATAVAVFFLKGYAATLLFKLFMIFANVFVYLIYIYMFSIYISHIKMGGRSSSNDHEQV